MNIINNKDHMLDIIIDDNKNIDIVRNIINVLKEFNDKYDIEDMNISYFLNDNIEIEDLYIYKDIDDSIIIKDYLQCYSLFVFK